MTEHSDRKKDIIREFCRSQGAPTAHWLARLSRDGRSECIRSWITKSRSPGIYMQTHAVVQQLLEERTNEDPCLANAEEIQEYLERARYRARERLDEEIRYGAICIEEIDSIQPWIQYNQYHELCDREWQSMVEGKRPSQTMQAFFDAPWYARLWTVLILAFVGFDGLLGIIGKPAHDLFSLGIASVVVLMSIFLAGSWMTRFLRRE